ncbi:MAG TPA: NUDIX hydrolase [Pyrinomonadaceae bacterium]
MSAEESTDMIRAAGALLWQGPPERRLIAVVHRNRYDDWTLPKGKLKKGESWQEAALREIKEETGYDARILGFAGAVAYEVQGRPKIVRYWHMAAQGEPAELENEVDELVWLPVEQAITRVQYPLEKALLEEMTPPD